MDYPSKSIFTFGQQRSTARTAKPQLAYSSLSEVRVTLAGLAPLWVSLPNLELLFTSKKNKTIITVTPICPAVHLSNLSPHQPNQRSFGKDLRERQDVYSEPRSTGLQEPRNPALGAPQQRRSSKKYRVGPRQQETNPEASLLRGLLQGFRHVRTFLLLVWVELTIPSQCTFCQRFFKPCMIWNRGYMGWRGEPVSNNFTLTFASNYYTANILYEDMQMVPCRS